MADDVPSNPSLSAVDGTDVSLDSIPLHSTTLLTLLDENGVVQYESPAIERLYGYDQDALVGEQVTDYFHPEDRERVAAAFRRVVASEDYIEEAVEYRHEQVDGTYTWVESVASANPTPDGYYVVNSRDISARKERERELERTNDRLEEFASIVSHDLRNPLNVAQLRLQQARDDADSDHLATVEQAHQRMEALIDELLTLARIEKRVTSLQSVALDSLSDRCWQTVATGESTLVVRTDRQVEADRQQLRQLLENLFRNAVEHGTGDVTVTVGDLPDGFSVEDDGPGIPPANRAAVFESGYSSTPDGTGFGLRIVERVVNAHDWTITVTDGSAGGARFEIVTDS